MQHQDSIGFWFRSIIHFTTIVAGLAFIWIAAVYPDLFEELNRKDSHEGAGLVENLTVLVLLPAIAWALMTVVRWRSPRPTQWIQLWLALWTLACVYFAGEECSWGQWYFGWNTPEVLAALNDQGETNLHNISSWLDQKPRALVEVFIIAAGLAVPVALRLKRRGALNSNSLASWILAPSLCWSAAAWFLLLRVSGFVPLPAFARLDSSELHELAIAWFLSLYLISYPVRFRELSAAKAPCTAPKTSANPATAIASSTG